MELYGNLELSGYTKKSAGILFKPEADAFSGGLVFYTNNSKSSNYADTDIKHRIIMKECISI